MAASSGGGSIQQSEFDAVAAEDYLRLSVEATEAARQHLQASSSRIAGNGSREYISSSDSPAGSAINFYRHQCEFLMVQLNKVYDVLRDEIDATISSSKITSGSPRLQLWPPQALRELYRVLMNVVSLIEACCREDSCLKAALRQSQRTQAFGEMFKEIVWCTSVVYYHSTFRYVKKPSMELQEFPHPRVGYREQFLLEKAAEADWQELMAKLEIWNRDHVCSGKGCGNMHEQGDPSRCLAAQILGRWKETESGILVGNAALPASGEADHQSLLCSFDKDVLKHGPTLGSGAFGSVSRVAWLRDNYAHKVFNFPGLSSLPAEAGALARMNHPHIVKVFAYSEDSFLMELMSTDLRKYIDNRIRGGATHPFSLSAATDLMLQVADAMRYLHSQKMTHRDLKSGNILVNPVNTPGSDGFVVAKIADFGLAKTKQEITLYSHLTHDKGTWLWMAPEIFEANRSDIHLNEAFPMKADVYSFGIICFEILSGEHPFQGIMYEDQLYKKLTATVPLRPQLPSSCPTNLASLIQRCWDTDPRKRPAFADVCRALRYLKGLLMNDLTEKQLGDVDLPSGTVVQDISYQMKIVQRQGPWGMKDRVPYNLFTGPSDGIRAVKLCFFDSEKRYLSGFQLMLDFQGLTFQIDKGGFNFGVQSTDWITFDYPSEYIVRVEGSTTTQNNFYGPHSGPFVTCLKFITNRDTYGPFGNFNQGAAFKSDTGRVAGFFGWTGHLIDLLGFLVVPDYTNAA